MSNEDVGTMRVIRTLYTSDSGEEREEEKKKLELQFRDSDHNLDQLVFQHQRDLTQVMQIYARVSNRLTSARTRVKDLKDNLIECKKMLHYKRDELKKMWLDGVEQKQVLELLNQIEMLKESPEAITKLLTKKNYLEATRNLVQALKNLNNNLRDVEGLIEVKTLLIGKQEKLYETLMEDLSRQLYTESTWEALQLRRQGSFKDNNPFQRAGSNRGSSGRRLEHAGSSGRNVGSGRGDSGRKPGENIRARRLLLDASAAGHGYSSGRLLSPSEEDTWHKIIEKPDLADIDEGPSHAMVVDLECIALLNKLPEAFETLKADLQNELESVVRRTSQMLIESGPFPQGDDRLLLELFTAAVDQLHLIVDAHRLLSIATVKAIERTGAEPARIDSADVWARVQTVMQGMLTDYLDFKSKTTLQQQNPAQFAEPALDINSYFVRRKQQQRAKSGSLFRFEYSSTALSMNDYLKEQNQLEAANQPGQDGRRRRNDRVLVCSPNPHNITPLYPQLMDFIGEIEKALSLGPGSHCTLYAFLMDYIKDVFLGQIHVDNGNALNAASHSLDSWKSITDPDVLRENNVTRPLLQSTYAVKKSIDELHGYMKTLPLYCEHFLTMICNVVMQYKEICQAAYRGVVQPESEDKRIISAQWAKDEDIARFLRSLPNWLAVQKNKLESLESPQEVDARNAKETSILKGNLGESDIPSHEILSDPNQLRSLAQLQESLDWFSASILSLSTEFTRSNDSAVGALPRLPDNSLQTLISLAKEFEELSDTCLLVLHLEVRVHCFFYLYSIWRGPAGAQFAGGQDSTDPNAEVLRLTRDLVSIEDALSNALQERKTRYIFEGVSHLVAAIFIGAAEHIRKINTNGVKKMCRNIFAVQHTLTSSITGSRETALDSAKQFYELFNLRPQEVLNGIVEKGPHYTREEYGSVLRLLHRSNPNSTSNVLEGQLEKLDDIMKKVGVAV